MSYITKLEDFKVIKTIGNGAFGRVSLVAKTSNGKYYALKSMSKEDLFRKNMATQIIHERNTLALSDCFFIVPLYYSFETDDDIHLIMEYMSGGDFSSLIKSHGFLSESTAKFYISEAALALNYLHSHDIIHHDIKLANFLMSSFGHLKLADFGLVKVKEFRQPQLSDFEVLKHDYDMHQSTPKRINITRRLPRTPGQILSLTSKIFNSESSSLNTQPTEKENDTCVSDCLQCPSFLSKTSKIFGTPDYLAPEVILKQPYNYKIDYWSLGVCLYEMVVGFPPFNDNDVDQIFDNIIKLNISFPSDHEKLSNELMASILALLNLDPVARADFNQLSTLSFFCDVDWNSIEKLRPPITPYL